MQVEIFLKSRVHYTTEKLLKWMWLQIIPIGFEFKKRMMLYKIRNQLTHDSNLRLIMTLTEKKKKCLHEYYTKYTVY